MDIFKLKPNTIGSYHISKNDFEFQTKKKYPYYNSTLIKDGTVRHFAVCPACDNPTQIIGLLNGTKLYAKHFKRSVHLIAPYIQENYDDCLLRAKNVKKLDKKDIRQNYNALSKNILKLLIEQFDRVIYILQQNIGIMISDKLAEDMLKNYLGEKGYLYRFSSLHNIPWIFAYFSNSQSLVGRIIFNNIPLKIAIETSTSLKFSDKKPDQVPITENKFRNLTFYFTEHKVRKEDESFSESLKFVVVYENKEIYTEEIIFDSAYFNALINSTNHNDKRKLKLTALAQKIFDEYA